MQRLVSLSIALVAAIAALALTIDTIATDPGRTPVVRTSPTPTSSVVTPSPTPTATAVAPAFTPSPASRPRDIAGARVIIQRLGIDLPLEWGDVWRDVPRTDYPGGTPEDVALVFPGSALPGAGGNTYIYSHARTGMFLSLWNVALGDVVTIRWPDGELRYEVLRIVPRVDPDDVSWLDPGAPERLTLQTSTGPSPTDPRFIVVATPRSAG